MERVMERVMDRDPVDNALYAEVVAELTRQGWTPPVFDSTAAGVYATVAAILSRRGVFASQEEERVSFLRDHFAGQALAVLGDSKLVGGSSSIAAFAYGIADAMLVERLKPRP